MVKKNMRLSIECAMPDESRVDPAKIWELIDREGITHYCGAPTVQIGIVNHPGAHKLARTVTCAVAGAPPSPTLLGRLKELGFRPVHVYGLTETYGPHTVCAWNAEWDALPPVEMAQKAAVAGKGGGLIGGATVVGLLAAGALTACLILALSEAMDAWLAALIVAVVMGAIAAALGLAGRNKVREAAPAVPEQTVETVKEDVQWAKTRTPSART